jgi:hypothetical protein
MQDFVRMHHFVRRSIYVPFRRDVWGMCGMNFFTVFVPLCMVLWVPIVAMLCKRAVPMLWHAALRVPRD